MEQKRPRWEVATVHLFTTDDQIPGTPLRGNEQKIRWGNIAYDLSPDTQAIAEAYWGVQQAKEAQWETRQGRPSMKQMDTLSMQFAKEALPGCPHETRTILDSDAKILEAIGFDYRHIWCLPDGMYIVNLINSKDKISAILKLDLCNNKSAISLKLYSNHANAYWQANSLTVYGVKIAESSANYIEIGQIIGLPIKNLVVKRFFNTPEGHAIFSVKKPTLVKNPNLREDYK